MRNAFTFVEVMICVSIMAIFAAIALPNFIEKKTTQTEDSPTVELKVSNHVLTIEKFTKEGHGYILIFVSGKYGCNILHDPDCPKCRPVSTKLEKE